MFIKHGDGKILSVIKTDAQSEEELDENGNPLKESRKKADKKTNSIKKIKEK